MCTYNLKLCMPIAIRYSAVRRQFGPNEQEEIPVLEYQLQVSMITYVYCLLCYHVSRVVRKPAFCICENKAADQLCGNREADQHLCFGYTDSTIPLLPIIKIQNFQPLAIFCNCTAWFVSDLVGNPEDWFSHKEAHVKTCACILL